MRSMPYNTACFFKLSLVQGLRLLALSLGVTCAWGQTVEEVIVKAEQSENQQINDLVSATAIDGEKLADAGIENVEDVSQYVPNLVLTESITGTNIYIRGIGAGTNQGFDQSVGLYSDGVPLPRSNMARAPFLDLAGIQVLRGPQYVLDGNYSIAGSVHMLTRLSADEARAEFDFNYRPDQDDRTLLVTAGGPISETLALNFVLQDKKSKGYVTNVFRGDDQPARDELFIRGVVGYRPTENLSFKLKAEQGSFDTTGRQLEVIFSEASAELAVTADDTLGNPLTRDARLGNDLIATPWITEADYLLRPRGANYSLRAGGSGNEFYFAGNEYLSQVGSLFSDNGLDIPIGLLDARHDYTRSADADEFSKNDSLNLTLVSDYQLGEHSFKATSSYIEYDYVEQIDGDLLPVNFIILNQEETYDQLFHSLSWESPNDRFLQVKAGASYLRSNLSFIDDINLPIQPDFNSSGTSLPFDPDFPLAVYLGGFTTFGTIEGFSRFRLLREFEQEATAQAAFVQATINWSDSFRTILGGRYTYSNKRATRDFFFTNKDGSLFALNIDPNVPGREGRTPNLGPADATALSAATRDYTTFFGLQVHTDKYDVAGQTIDGAGLSSERREEAFLPSITAEWDLNSSVSLLASVRQANKLGGFDARSNTRPDVAPGTNAPAGTFEFKDEEAITYEVGARAFIPGGQVFATAFFTDFTNLQVSRSDGNLGANVDNAGAARTKGIEIEGLQAITENFSLQYSLAWIDFEFTDFLLGSCSLNRRPDNIVTVVDASGLFPGAFPAGSVIPIAYEEVVRDTAPFATVDFQGSPNLTNPLPDGFEPFDEIPQGAPVFCDFNGQTNQFVADWQGTFTFNYRQDASQNLAVNYTLDVIYNSGYATDVTQDDDVAQDAYTLLNGRIELADPDDIWSIAITGQNLTDEKVVSSAGQLPFATGLAQQRAYFGFVQPPRTIGLNLKYSFY